MKPFFKIMSVCVLMSVASNLAKADDCKTIVQSLRDLQKSMSFVNDRYVNWFNDDLATKFADQTANNIAAHVGEVRRIDNEFVALFRGLAQTIRVTTISLNDDDTANIATLKKLTDQLEICLGNK